MSLKKLAILGGEPEFKKFELLIKPSLPNLKEIEKQLLEVHNSVFITNGIYNRTFEEKFCEFIGNNQIHALSVSNATIGLIIALAALQYLSNKNEVITTPFTFPATGYSILWNNLKPVFADIDFDTKNLSPEHTEKLINNNTLAIMPVYIFSNPPEIDNFIKIAKDNNVFLVFDAAQAIGSKYKDTYSGNFGDIEIFSFAPTKVLTTVEGGMITTKNEELYKIMKAIRDAGKVGEYDFDYLGINGRMTEYQAIIGLYNLSKLDLFIEKRKQIVEIYKKYLSNIPGINFQIEQKDSKLTYNYMVIFIDEEKFGLSRDNIYEILKRENIQTKKYFYPSLVNMKPFEKFYKQDNQNLYNALIASKTGLALPLYNTISEKVVKTICNLIIEIYRNRDKINGL